MRVRLKRDIKISTSSTGDVNGDVVETFQMKKGMIGTVEDMRSYYSHYNQKDRILYAIKWDGFVHPRLHEIAFDDTVIEQVDVGINMKGFKI